MSHGCIPDHAGAAAAAAANVFHYLTYEEMVDMEAITDPAERRVTLLQVPAALCTPRLGDGCALVFGIWTHVTHVL